MAVEHGKCDRRGALLDVTQDESTQKAERIKPRHGARTAVSVRRRRSVPSTVAPRRRCRCEVKASASFCAGGDIVAVRAAGLEDKPTTPFFREEYALNARTGALRESRVVQCSFWDGFTFGGGVGLSVHGKYRIATEKTQLAMPEVAIGLICTQARGPRHRARTL